MLHVVHLPPSQEGWIIVLLSKTAHSKAKHVLSIATISFAAVGNKFRSNFKANNAHVTSTNASFNCDRHRQMLQYDRCENIWWSCTANLRLKKQREQESNGTYSVLVLFVCSLFPLFVFRVQFISLICTSAAHEYYWRQFGVVFVCACGPYYGPFHRTRTWKL